VHKIFVCDLTHTALGISALTFPLGGSFVASYAQAKLGDRFDVELFKFPDKLSAAIETKQPQVIGFSGYSWNFELSYSVACWAKERFPGIAIVFGGPNFPVLADEQQAFLEKRPAIDFYIQNEGEIGFVDILNHLEECDFDVNALKEERHAIPNGCYLLGEKMITGKVARILDVNEIPSPYLSGMLDEFFETPLIPMIETTRGCPFSCAFCADGLASKNRVVRFETDRTDAELTYIADRAKDVDELIITDLNFGMYKQDTQTAEYIAKLQAERRWPLVVKASAGKNKPDRIINTARILGGSWILGSSVQSTDAEVLANIKRSNISTEVYRKFVGFVNSQEYGMSASEIILCLPGDTREKHFNSLRSCIENGVSTIRMFQAMMLLGTDMASQETRERFGLLTRYRIIPGCVGEYRFGDDVIRTGEIEEIIVGSKDMPFEDYVSCRIMNLLVEAFVNNGLYEEVFTALRHLGVPAFDILEHIHAHPEVFTPRLAEIIASFKRETEEDLFESHEEAQAAVSDPAHFQSILDGKIASNELLGHRALMYLEFEDLTRALMAGAFAVLAERGKHSDSVSDYLGELARYVTFLKADVHEHIDIREAEFRYDFSKGIGDGVDAIETGADIAEDTRLRFFHTSEQRKHISNSINVYRHHPGGIGRLIQRSNLKLFFRHVEKVT